MSAGGVGVWEFMLLAHVLCSALWLSGLESESESVTKTAPDNVNKP